MHEAVAAGARRDEGDSADPVAGELGIATGEAHDRHAAHRVADEDDLAVGGRRVDDGPQVLAQLVDGAALEVAGLRCAVVALVVADDAVAGVDERAPLEDPGAEVEHEAVDEHDGRPGLRGPALRLVDLDVQHDPVVGRDGLHLVRDEGEDVHLVVVGHRIGAGALDRGPARVARTGDRHTADGCGRQADAGRRSLADAAVLVLVHHWPPR